MSATQIIDVDLGNNVFSIHGVNAYGKCDLRKTVKKQNLSFVVEIYLHKQFIYIALDINETQCP